LNQNADTVPAKPKIIEISAEIMEKLYCCGTKNIEDIQ
jgi:hypothetical protein